MYTAKDGAAAEYCISSELVRTTQASPPGEDKIDWSTGEFVVMKLLPKRHTSPQCTCLLDLRHAPWCMLAARRSLVDRILSYVSRLKRPWHSMLMLALMLLTIAWTYMTYDRALPQVDREGSQKGLPSNVNSIHLRQNIWFTIKLPFSIQRLYSPACIVVETESTFALGHLEQTTVLLDRVLRALRLRKVIVSHAGGSRESDYLALARGLQYYRVSTGTFLFCLGSVIATSDLSPGRARWMRTERIRAGHIATLEPCYAPLYRRGCSETLRAVHFHYTAAHKPSKSLGKTAPNAQLCYTLTNYKKAPEDIEPPPVNMADQFSTTPPLPSGDYYIRNVCYRKYLTEIDTTKNVKRDRYRDKYVVEAQPDSVRPAKWSVVNRCSDGRYLIGQDSVNTFYECRLPVAEMEKQFGWTLQPHGRLGEGEVWRHVLHPHVDVLNNIEAAKRLWPTAFAAREGCGRPRMFRAYSPPIRRLVSLL
ncbi:hypothetical protein NM688_g757 [Phlebia brevispora]|uniref:Uncharacterized protein n=1 Tax=Phlebia brevispora TaxID=194682 RepID=A0ACC1TDB1_9APHY|nr:hypothetical protein NM688_g757 [Phlebia brevispora]